MKYKWIVLFFFLISVFFLSSHSVSASVMCIMRACPDVDCPNGIAVDSAGCTTCSCNTTCRPAQTPSGLRIADYTNGIIQWDATMNAATYDIRINDTANGWVGDCAKAQQAGDACINGVRGTTFNYLGAVGHTFQPGHSYSIWVHSVNRCSYSAPAGLNISISATTPTPYIQINVKNPQGGAVVVPFLGFSYGGCGGYNQCFSVVGYNKSSYTIYGYQRSPGGGGIALGTNQMYMGVTPSVGGGSTNITNNNVCRSGYCTPENNTNWYNYWWPTFPSTGSRSLTFVVATPTPIPPPGSSSWVRCLGNFMSCDAFCGSRGQTCSNSCTGFGGCTGTNQGYNQAESWAMNGSKCWNQGACNKKIESPQPSYNATFPNLCHEWFNAACCCGSAPPPPTNTPTPIPPTPDACPRRAEGNADCGSNGVVNEADFAIIKSALNGAALCTNCTADFNKDNNVNMVDFEIWRKTFYQ